MLHARHPSAVEPLRRHRATRGIGRHRVVRFHRGAGGDEFAQQYHRRRLAHVIGAGLERESPHPECEPAKIGTETRSYLLEQALFLRLVARLDRRQYHRFDTVLPRRVNQGPHVLGQARTAVAAAGVDERIADAAVGADAFAHVFHVDTRALAHVGDLVHE